MKAKRKYIRRSEKQKAKILAEYAAAPRSEKHKVLAKYGVVSTLIYVWQRKYKNGAGLKSWEKAASKYAKKVVIINGARKNGVPIEYAAAAERVIDSWARLVELKISFVDLCRLRDYIIHELVSSRSAA